jgi:hypothetical protein
VTWHAGDAVVNFAYTGNTSDYLFRLLAEAPAGSRAPKSDFAGDGRHLDAGGSDYNTDVLGESRIDFCLQQLACGLTHGAPSSSGKSRICGRLASAAIVMSYLHRLSSKRTFSAFRCRPATASTLFVITTPDGMRAQTTFASSTATQ